MQKLKNWAEARPHVKTMIFLPSFLFPALAFAQIFLSWHSSHPSLLPYVGQFLRLPLSMVLQQSFLFPTACCSGKSDLFRDTLSCFSYGHSFLGVFLFLFCLFMPVFPLAFLF